MAWPRIDHGDDLDRNCILCLSENDGRGIGKSNLRRASGHLFDCVARALASYDLHVDAGVLIVALLESDIIIGMAPVEAEVRNECDVVRRFHMAGLDAENNERSGRGATDRFHVSHVCTLPPE